MFKLLKGPQDAAPELLSDATLDRATRESDLPIWPGTVIGIDINIGDHHQFAQLLSEIRVAYSLDVREKKKAKYRRPRFG